MDYVYCYLSYFGYKAGQAIMDGFWAEMDRLGKDRNPYRAGFLQFVGVAESREQAMELYREPAEYFYGRCLHVDAALGDAARLHDRGDAARRLAEPGGEGGGRDSTLGKGTQERFAGTAKDMEDIVDRGYVIIGSPDEVAEQLREVANDAQRRPPHAAAAVRQHGQAS